MSIIITVVVIVINEVLTAVTFSLIKWIKMGTRSQETAVIVKVLFITYFFNTAIILLMVNMNMGEHEPGEVWSLINGRYKDYSPNWYKDIGMQIYQTYFVQIFMPFVLLLIELLLLGINYGLDTGCTCNKRRSKTKNVHQFMEMYTGPDFNIDISFLYGD